MAKADGVSPDMARFLASLTIKERESLLEVLREPQTYLAGDMTDVIAILKAIHD
jgi:hypothetical protein